MALLQADLDTPVDREDVKAERHIEMRVQKRSGAAELVDVNKIVRAVERCTDGLAGVDPLRVATRTISGLRDGATTLELDELSIRTAAALISEEPNYSRLAARLLSTVIDKEVRNQDVCSFSQSVALGHSLGLISDVTAAFVRQHRRKLDDAISEENDRRFEFFGLRTVYDRYLLRHPEHRSVIETPQYFLLRVAAGLAESAEEAIELYSLMSSLEYLPSSPTLFNSGTAHSQMSSCYLLDSPKDELGSIYERYGQIAQLSKFAGGIGFAFHRVRSRGSLIKGTNGLSNGIVPWLKTLDASVAAVNQGGRRKGAACVYLESWHADIEEFLELRDNTGDEGRRVRTINLANWVPDLFMERVENDFLWSLFDPKQVPELIDSYGEEFRTAYLQAEADGRYERQVPARQLYGKMMRSLAQTGNGWMTFKDRSNELCNQTGKSGGVVHLSNLCTEIIEVTSNDETAVCNLGSINLGRFITDGRIDTERLSQVVRTAITYLDRVIDINFYPTPQSSVSNAKWRPVGLGMMGLQDALFQLRLPFDSEEARVVAAKFAEEIYFNALWRSTELAEEFGPHTAFAETRAASGALQFDLWGVVPSDPERWAVLRERIATHGLRNSLLVAVAPDVDDCVDRQLLRDDRASGVEPVQARDAVGRVPPDQHLPRARPAGARPVDRTDHRRDQACRGLDPRDRCDPPGDARSVPHRLGAAAEGDHRPGGGARPVHRPEPVAQPVRRVAEHRQVVLDVHVRLERGPEDHLLPALASRDPDHADDDLRRAGACSGGRARANRRRRRRDRLLPREPRAL